MLVLLLLAILSAVWAAPDVASPLHGRMVRHEWHEPEHTRGWVRRERLAANATLPMRIGFAAAAGGIDSDDAHALLLERADPQSARYGQHLSAAAVAALFAPSEAAVEAVRAWIVAEGGIAATRLSLSANGQWLQFEARVDEAERLLRTQYHSYEHAASGVHLTACAAYHVPAALQSSIDYVLPGVKLASYGFDARVRPLVEARRRRRRIRREPIPETRAQTDQSDQTDQTDRTRRHVRARQAAKVPMRPSNATDAPPPWVSGGCERTATLDCIRAQYGMPSPDTTDTANKNKMAATVPPVGGNELGVFEALGLHYAQHDVDVYMSYVAPQMPVGTAPELRAVNGALGPVPANQTVNVGLEADLDLEIAMPLIYPQTTVLWQVDDEWYETHRSSGYPGFFNTFFDAIDGSYCSSSAFGETGNCQSADCRDPVYPDPHAASPDGYQGALMCGTFKPTNVISISYSNAEQSMPAAYLKRQCLEILKLGLQGVTVVESAGDTGVGGASGRSGDPFLGCLGADRTVFSPRSLCDCPYVLAVGATVLTSRDPYAPDGTNSSSSRTATSSRNGTDSRSNSTGIPGSVFMEKAPTRFSTGGGFSNIFETPLWQQTAVADYLDKHAHLSFQGYAGSAGYNLSRTGQPQPPGVFNLNGRAYPDVAAVGQNVPVVYEGYATLVAGTSVATPIWAAVLTLLNEARLLANKSTVGFVHPTLYQHPEVFTDITEGSNPGCGSRGFPATTGWDPVSGLGTPLFPKLRDLFLSLP